MSQTAIYRLDEISRSGEEIKLGETDKGWKITVRQDFGHENSRQFNTMTLMMTNTDFSIFLEKDPQGSVDSTETRKWDHFYVCPNSHRENPTEPTDVHVFRKDEEYTSWEATRFKGSVVKSTDNGYTFCPVTDGGTETQEKSKLVYQPNSNLFKSHAWDASYMYMVMLSKAPDGKDTCIAFKSSEPTSSPGPKLFKDEEDKRTWLDELVRASSRWWET